MSGRVRVWWRDNAIEEVRSQPHRNDLNNKNNKFSTLSVRSIWSHQRFSVASVFLSVISRQRGYNTKCAVAILIFRTIKHGKRVKENI